MLKGLFQWLDVHPGSFWILAGMATLLVVLRVWSAVRAQGRGPGAGVSRTWGDGLVLFVFLFAWRWPFLLAANDFNPDESQLIAGAITLSHDPVFWRSVDGTTSGPLNFYLLVPYAWLGIPLDYFTARLTGLLLVGGAIFASYLTLAGRFGRTVAWLGVLPAAAFFATVTYADLIHYSSEHLALFLTAVAIWLLAGRDPAERGRLWLACFIAGAAVWAKLQAAPLSVALIAWGFWQVTQESGVAPKIRWRKAFGVGLAALAPTLLAVALIAATGQMEAALRRYFIHNLFYVGDARPFGVALQGMNLLAMKDGRLPLLLVTGIAIILAASLYFVIRRLRPSALFFSGGFLTLAALVAVLAPRREYLHYALLLPVPLTLWVGAAVGGWWTGLASARGRLVLTGLLFLGAGLPPVLTRCLQPRPEIYGQFAYNWSHPRTSAAALVHALAGRDGSLAIWGWANNLYVETALPQATRDAHSVWSIQPNAQRDYHRACYLDDLRRHEPSVLVDAVGPGAFSFENRPTQAHEIFPELAEYISRNYTFVTDLGAVRIYARDGLASLATMSPSRIRVLMAQGRRNEADRTNAIPAPVTRIDNFQRKTIAQREVLMLLPPAQVEWALDDDMSGVSLEFGFDPVAYQQGQSNGAELFLELADAQGVHPLFHCLLDPAREADDRQPQLALVSLPPFAPGARLILRTDPGQYGDTAWDWVYLANLKFDRHARTAADGLH